MTIRQEKVISGVGFGSLRSLALGMARLGLRHPEIFRCLGQVVRRSGLWSFGDHEDGPMDRWTDGPLL